MPAYHRVRRKVRLFRKRPGFLKNISDTPYRVDQFIIEILVNLVAQIAYARFDNIGLRAEVVIPDVFHDHRLGNDPAGVAHQVFEQRKLPGLQVDLFTPSSDLPGEEIDGQVPDGQADRIGNAARPADQGRDLGPGVPSRQTAW